MIRMPLATASLLAIAISLAGCGEGKDKAAAPQAPTPAASTAAPDTLDRHRRVAEHGFWPRCGHFEVALPTAERVAEVPEITIHFFHLHLQVTHR